MPGGRPTDYDPSFCDDIVRVMGEGHSVAGFAGTIGAARSTVFLWASKHPEFMDALKAGQSASALFWELRLIQLAQTGGAPGQVTAVIFALKNRVAEDWRDQVSATVKHTGHDDGPIKIEDNLSPLEVARRIAFTFREAEEMVKEAQLAAEQAEGAVPQETHH